MSQYNTFFIPHSDDGAEQESLNSFLRTHRVLQVERQAFPQGWAFCVEWIERGGGTGGRTAYGKPGPKVDYREVLDAASFGRFAKLRERRKTIAEEDDVKAYVVMTDAQMAELAKVERPTLADLERIPGIGDSRIKLYGPRLLADVQVEKDDGDLL